jgi:hypothetical protein
LNSFELEAIMASSDLALKVQKSLCGQVTKVLYFMDSVTALWWVLNMTKKLGCCVGAAFSLTRITSDGLRG